ncbi:MAG: hypothetical protein HPY85_17500 [Anaerolineae bacterium]|nr:hypothetical protein [Anaerolineae bacterium]
MNDRERMIAWLLGKPVDRPPFWLFWGAWDSTWRRWESEGKPPACTDLRTWFGSDRLPGAVTVNCGPCPLIDTAVLAEDDETITFRDSWGILRRDFKHGVSMPQFLDFPVKSWEDWYTFRDTWLDPHHPRRLDGPWREQCAAWAAEGRPIQLGNYPDVGIFGTFRWLMGDEEGLVAFHTRPDLVHAIMEHMTTLYLVVFEQVVREVPVDRIHLWEDMCYRGGPLISPRHWREFLGPHYRRIKAFADAHGIPILSVDTDGNPWKIAEPMIETGVNLLLPMEVAAGCDVDQWQAAFPGLAMMGGIDKRALAQDFAAIDRELERIRPALARGRYIPELDHLVPDDVPWRNYCYYAERLKQLVYTSKVQ